MAKAIPVLDYLDEHDLVTEAARIIAPEGFSVWTETSSGKEPEGARVRRLYKQSDARVKALHVLRLAANTDNLNKVLAEVEKDDWGKMGVRVRGNADLEAIVEGKYKGPPSRRHVHDSTEKK